MSDQPPSSMIEWIFAAPLLGIAAAAGASIKWVWDRVTKDRASREQKIEAREHEYVKRQDARIDELERREAERDRRDAERAIVDKQRDSQVLALRVAFEIVAGEIRRTNPESAELKRAEALLQAAFGVPMDTPADMIAALAAMQ